MVKKQQTTVNPKNNDDRCFQYAVRVALNYKNILKDLQRIKITDFYCFNCCHSHGSINQFKKHENVSQIQGYCYTKVPKKVKY